MQPIGNLFGKFPRVVRDLGRQLGKQVEMTIVGRDVELDKTILEQLSDPLTHLVRNSVDHGIETPAERLAKGKPATGQITLTAAHEDGQVRIEIRDDGRGIDPQAVRTKALAMRLKTESELDKMSPRELMGLILLPGFSTARQVTEVSGRGVGMDVVKTNIELLEGSLVIDSLPGLGTAMILRMPLTLAIIPCLIVTVSGERYAIPQRELEEAVCLHPGMSGRIEQAFDTEVYRMRDRLLPIVRLRDVLNRPAPFTPEAKAEILAAHAASANIDPARIEYILVLRLPGRRFGLVVDEVRGTEEVVVKPMHPSIKRVGIFTGATIMGDGRVALIADVTGIVEHARLSFDSVVESSSSKASDARKSAQAHRVLLFEYGPHEQFALPLLQIRRIEMVGRDRVERVGEHEYVTVDGVSMRILRLDKVINVSAPEEASAESDSQMSLILPKFGDQAMAIVVSRIVDTESLLVDLQEHPEQDRGILGSAVVRGRLTLFLDIHRLSQKMYGKSLPVPAGAASTQRPRRLLLIDDTPFFREVVKRYLMAEGHEVETAVNGEDALEQLAKDRKFDLIVSDIEMPVMDGWEFAREARRRGVKTPMLALTSLSGVPYEVKAKDCGYDSYEVKLDHDRLVRKVGHMLAVQAY
jgi:two-component system chemotaxis sensor kinase CheA